MDDRLSFINEDGVECKDLLNSFSYIKDFHSFVIDTDLSVYALSGDWGTGKSSFIQMWENYLNEKREYRFCHIDAFKKDYESEPFIMLTNGFKPFLDEPQRKKVQDLAKNIFTYKNIAKLGLNILADKIGKDSVKDFINNAFDSYFDELSKEHTLYDNLRTTLSEIADKFTSPVLVIIDELDRCRPDFALETLERVKHIFNIKNVKFILVYNEKIMSGIIHQKYGQEIDIKKYLDKFVQVTYYMNKAKSLNQFYNHIVNSSFKFVDTDMQYLLINQYPAIVTFTNMYDLSLRDIERLIHQLVQYQNCGNIPRCITLASLEILKKVNSKEYTNMITYYNENNKHFADNAPDRYNFKKIYNTFELGNGRRFDTAEEAFYDAMNYLDGTITR